MPSRFGSSFLVAAKMRVDQVMADQANVSRREAKRLLDSGRVTLNGRVLGAASRMVSEGDRIAIIASDVSIPILELRDDLVVIDKPAALPSQPTPTSSNVSVIDVVSAMLKQRGEGSDAYIVHRLDTNTTGVMAVARSSDAAERYSKLISGGASMKKYVAIATGRIRERIEIDAPVGRATGNLFDVRESGKSARSEVMPISWTDEASLVSVTIATGRTHQIRVHLKHVGHPVVGDRKYGDPSTEQLAARPMLHAFTLALPRIGEWTAPLPDDLLQCARALGLEVGPIPA